MSRSPEDVQAARRKHSKFAEVLMKRMNVVACGVGYKVSHGKTTGEPSVIVSVTRKMPRNLLPEDEIIPSSLEDVPTDVIETGLIRALALDRQGRVRPLRPGISLAHVSGSAGTLGCLVQRGGEFFALSNNHVLALLNAGMTGDAILQPGPADGGTLLDAIGTLADYIPLHFTDEETSTPIPGEEPAEEEPRGCAALIGGLFGAAWQISAPTTAEPVVLNTPVTNYVDAALVDLAGSVDFRPDIIDVGGPPLGVTDPSLGMRLIKSGRTTGLTQGTVIQFDVTVDVKYGDRTARFANQIMSTPFSQPGDSGSLVLNYERSAIGLLFSGSQMVTVINPIASVLKALRVDLVLAG